MSALAIPKPPLATLAIQGEDTRFPVRRIYCVGRNYAAHVREMGNDERDPPFFFMKPTDAAVDASIDADASVAYPPLTGDLHHEVELVVAISEVGTDIAQENALDHVFGYAAGFDLTRRDLQADAKEAGRPWDWAKGFDDSAPIGAIGRRDVATDFAPTAGRIFATLDDDVKQDGDLSEQIWSVAEIIARISQGMVLAPGDIIMTGTPAGVGPVQRGGRLRGSILGLPDVAVAIY